MAQPSASVLPYFERLGEALGRDLASRFAPPVLQPTPVVKAPAARQAKRPSAPPAARQAKRPSAPPAARKPKRATRAAQPRRVSKALVPGAQVSYRQGRGSFAAEVVRVDTLHGMATLQRSRDGKRVVRPLDRVYAP